MKRLDMGYRSSAMVQNEEGEQGFWPSFADMMSAIALILFFLMLLAYVQNILTGNELKSAKGEVETMQASLNATLQQVEDAKGELALLQGDLETARANIAADQEALAQYEQTIAANTQTINDQMAYITATSTELTQIRSQMQTIALLRLSTLEKIKASIESVLGGGASVRIGDNGNIILNEGLFFDYNSDQIKEGSETVLDKLAEAFRQFLAEPGNTQYVDSIVISGHTDNTGDAEYNRDLSTRRANAVLNYLLSHDGGVLTPYEQYFCSAGYGVTRPIAVNTTEEGRGANRRIEISIILRDETVLQIVDSYLQSTQAGPSAQITQP